MAANDRTLNLEDIVPKPPSEVLNFIERVRADPKISDTAVTEAACVASKRITGFVNASSTEQLRIRQYAKDCGVVLPIDL
jgi:hypothetical protein